MVYESVPEYSVVGMGNPLLDIMVQVEKDVLIKYDLKDNDAILAEDKHMALFDEILKREDVTLVPGGATQNTLRVFQWIIGLPNRATFFGAVGVDNYSNLLSERAKIAGLNVRYQFNRNIKTGTCAGLIFQHNRSLCADLGAANTFTVDHLEIEDNAKLIENAKLFYISGFFLTVCPPAAQKIAKHAADKNKIYCMNLAAVFICDFFSNELNAILPYIDFLFANEVETLAYAKANNFDTTNLIEIAKKICNFDKVNKQRERTVIVTQGPNEIIIAVGNNDIQKFTVPKVENIVDTNGAGDAFCGGFLAELVRGNSLKKCVDCGCYASSVIIQNQGCTFPEKSSYKY